MDSLEFNKSKGQHFSLKFQSSGYLQQKADTKTT